MNRRELLKDLGASLAGVAVAAKVTSEKKQTTVVLPPAEEGSTVLVKNLAQHETVVIVSDGQTWHQV